MQPIDSADISGNAEVPRSRRRLTPWMAPVLTAAVVVGGGALVAGAGSGTAFADQHPTLPARSAAQLLADVAATKTAALSGTVVETANWGLPALPGADSASLSWQNLLTGTHRVQVAVDGPTKQRIAMLGSLSEADAVRNGNSVWTYTSAKNEATHLELSGAKPGAGAESPAPEMTPLAMAQQLLAGLDPTTKVTVSETELVAGRSTYTLLLAPKDDRSTLRQVAISVDSETSVPLRVQLFGAGVSPVFDVAFDTVSFATPAASTFDFTPPAGASVTTKTESGTNAADHPAAQDSSSRPSGVKILGTGWTSIVEVPASVGAEALAQSSGQGRNSSASGLLNSLTSLDSAGNRTVNSAVLHALITSDGRVFVGAVNQSMLKDAARTAK